MGQEKEDSIKVYKEIQMAKSVFRSNPDSTISLLKGALEISESSGYYEGHHLSLTQLGIYSLLTGNEEGSIIYFNRSLDLAIKRNDLKRTSVALSNIGNYYNHVGNWNTSLDIYMRALKLKKALNDRNGMGVLYTNIGIIFDKQGNHEMALDNYEEAVEIKKELKDSISLANDMLNIGIVYAELKEFDKAVSALESARLMAESLGDDFLYSLSLTNLAEMNFELGRTKVSLDYAEKGLNVALSLGSPVAISQAYHVLSQLAEQEDDLQKAVKYAKLNLSYIRIAGEKKEEIHALDRLSRLEEKRGNFESALDYLGGKNAIQDSLESIEIQKNLNELSIKYEKLITEQELLNREKEVQVLERDKTIKNITITGIALGGALIISILIFYILQKRSQIEKQRIKAALLEEKANKLTLDLKHRNKELLSFAVQTANKNEAIQTIKEQLQDELKKNESEISDKRIENMFKQVENTENDWKEFRMRFEQIDQEFFNKLTQNYNSLTDTDLRICAMIKLKLTSKEIANILNITPESVNKSRYRLRKKLGLDKEIDLNHFISNI